MRVRTIARFGVVVLGGLGLYGLGLYGLGGGCSAPGAGRASFGANRPAATAASYSLRQLHGHSVDALLAAEAAFGAEGFAVAKRSAESGSLQSVPLPGDPASEPRAARARLGSRRPIRRIAEVRIDGTGDRLKVFCRVGVYEQTTELHRMRRDADLRASDSPSATPIEREGAANSARANVWRFLRRDKAAERRLLSAIANAMDVRDDDLAGDGGG